ESDPVKTILEGEENESDDQLADELLSDDDDLIQSPYQEPLYFSPTTEPANEIETQEIVEDEPVVASFYQEPLQNPPTKEQKKRVAKKVRASTEKRQFLMDCMKAYITYNKDRSFSARNIKEIMCLDLDQKTIARYLEQLWKEGYIDRKQSAYFRIAEGKTSW